LEALEFQ
nr:Chain C, MNV1-NS6 peptide LEALEFQ [Murine norovirus 1]8A5M_E Chain E, MNV1-NS6 peptide LEALEFQ [Murine norovirus 1]